MRIYLDTSTMLKTLWLHDRVNAVSRNERLGSNGRIFSFTMPKYNLNDVLMAYRADARAASREIQNSTRPRKSFVRFDSIQLRPRGRLAKISSILRSFPYVGCVCDEFFDVPVAFNFKCNATA